ncbi:MAG: DUF5685 family protein [Lachnospiraceae bacterium]|nr:DUF5685 family protein [Lachnospiraceae bacterium]
MFGYVNVNQPELKIREYTRYRGFYCGLCRSLKDNYGIRSRLSLSYDMTFLVMLLTSLYEPDTQEKHVSCALHPLQKHLELRNRFSDYGADMNMLCTLYMAQDNILDAGSFKEKAVGNGLSALYRKAFKKLKLKYPGKIERMEHWLARLHELEAENCTDLDTMSGLSGHIIAEIFTPRNDEWTDELTALGFYLGKFIYLMDAWEDIEKDQAEGKYNPLLPIYNKEDSDHFNEICRSFMTVVMADCATHFERLPLIEDVEILRNIIYSGIWTRYELTLNKRNSEKQTDKASGNSLSKERK